VSYLAGKYDVVVIGAGHAGCEAALAAARMGVRTLLLTINMDSIALMPCNPTLGSPAKSHLVREIDALGGAMGIVADRTQIQIRMLNTGKGPAVQSLRAQIDKKLYQQEMTMVLENQANLDVKQDMADRVLVEKGRVCGVVTKNGFRFDCRTVVLTTGTYLRGRIIIGEVNYPGGPSGQAASVDLVDSLRDCGWSLRRFKTGTPARVDKRSIDFSKTVEHPGDSGPLAFSYLTDTFDRPNVSCWLTYTNERTHQIIRDNIHRAPLFTGMIEGIGPRYCPSIEDKVVRFADKTAHQLFLEPEGLTTLEYYVQGMSSSLPVDVQIAFMRTIPGLENVSVIRPAYAIEYDCIDSTQLKANLESKEIRGFFTAGQINGSSGYEEAAAQGLMAGVNAALLVLEREPLILKRSDAYIGVLIDDLVTKGTNEPYRLMTARAEYRLILRQDNADLRLTEIGRQIGLVDDLRWERFQRKQEMAGRLLLWMETERISPEDDKLKDLLQRRDSSDLRGPVSLHELLKRPEISLADVLDLAEKNDEYPHDVQAQVETQVKFQGYIKKQLEQVARFNKLESKLLPEDIDYREIRGLRLEAQQKLTQIRPASIGQASRISGVSPADISVLMVYLEQQRRIRPTD